MAVVYDNKKTRRMLALTQEAQDGLDRAALRAGIKAEGMLRAHRHDGHAAIEVEEGNVDRYVTLSDERGLKAALSIEYGRQPQFSELEDGSVAMDGGMEGLFILHKAFNFNPKEV